MSKNSPTTRRILELTQERDAARIEAEGLRQDKQYAEKAYDNLNAAVVELRKQLEDMRKQRDRAVEEAERERSRARAAQSNLSRAMGWIDAKMDKPPFIDDTGEWPF
jgi:predicted  nucleic acid-binding Zn-ribbon protein